MKSKLSGPMILQGGLGGVVIFLVLLSNGNCANLPAKPCSNTVAIGVEDRNVISDNQISASSVWRDGLTPASVGRLNHLNGWCSGDTNAQQWLQVDFGRSAEIYCIATQGAHLNAGNFWVTDFKLSYSSDNGTNWTPYFDTNGSEMEFHRNGNSQTIDMHTLPVPVSAWHIRFHPTAWQTYICLRVEVYVSNPSPPPSQSTVVPQSSSVIPSSGPPVIQDNPVSDDCRIMQFKQAIVKRILVGHVIESVLVKSEIGCEANCFENDDCMSVNFGPLEEGKHLCELSSSDHDIHPEDLKERNEFVFKPVWNYCSSKSCPPGRRCQTGFTGKRYRCIASNKENKDVDECVTGQNDCDDNADCVNTPGSFLCTCKEGYLGNGTACVVSVTFSSSSYAVFDTKKTWEAASSSCRGFGAELVKIESQAETEFINATFLSTPLKMWIGLNDIVNEGDWKWSDGSSLEGYTNWGHREPNNYLGKQHCVAIVKGVLGNYDFQAEWNDFACNKTLVHLCEK